MEDGNPLVYVGLTYLLLWGLGRYLARQNLTFADSARSGAFKPQGIKFAPGLRVAGIDKAQVDDIKELLATRNEADLALFIAKYQPKFVEIDAYFNTLRDRFLGFLEKPASEATEIEKISASNRVLLTDHPKQIPIRTLNPSELRAVYSFNPDTRLIDAQLVEKFAGKGFMERLYAYRSLRADTAITLHIPKAHNTRQIIEALLDSQLVIQGKDIPFKERLEVAALKRLQDIATQLNLDTTFKSVRAGIDLLASTPGAEAVFETFYKPNDLFRVLNDQHEDLDKAIDTEWSMIQAYVKLLCYNDD